MTATTNILALDLAKNIGWAAATGDGITSGAWNLEQFAGGAKPVASPEVYWALCRDWLTSMADDCDIGTLVVERGFHHGKVSVYLGGLVMVARLLAYDTNRRFLLVPNATWKSHARKRTKLPTSATKGDYLRESRRVLSAEIRSNDEADARWILDWYLAIG